MKIDDKTSHNSPSLRFPEFTGEWENKRIGDIGKFFSGGTPSSSRKDFYGGEIPFIRSGEIHSDKTELFLTQEGYKNSSAKMVEVGDILLALYGANSGDISISQMRGAINQAILCIRTNVAPVFFKSVWEKHAQKILNTYLQGGQGNLSADIVKKITISIPSQIEQAKIAALFSHLDERISIQNRLIEDLKKLRCAVSNKLFQSVKGVAIPLSCISNIVKGKQINGDFLADVGEYYVMNGGTEPSGYYDNYNVEANTISISEGGNSCGYVQFNRMPFWSGGHCYTIQDIASDVETLYLYHYLKSKEDSIMKLRIGTGLPNIQKKDLAEFKVIIPAIEQQRTISNILSLLERKTEIEGRMLIAMRTEKQYLLHQMFI